MPQNRGETRIPLSLFHTPTEVSQQLFYSVLRAGHIVSAPGYRIARRHYPGHEFLLCLRGKGFIQVFNRTWPVVERQIAWIDCSHPHSHWPDKIAPWEIYWIRVEGGNLNQVYLALAVDSAPVFSGFNMDSIGGIYQEIFQLLRDPSGAMEASLNARVAALVGLLFEVRFKTGEGLASEPAVPNVLQKCIETIRLYYHLPLNVPELADLAGVSVSHFFRVFKKATGMTPIQCLKRERINHAKRKLIETADSIAAIAEQTGYSDQFYFSRDFKRMTRMTPSKYRAQERASRSINGHRLRTK